MLSVIFDIVLALVVGYLFFDHEIRIQDLEGDE